MFRCWVEVDLHALRANLAWIRHRIGAQARIITVVKADAYGHGLRQIAACLMQSGTDIFGVANLAEAQSIRAVGRGWPVLMLGACLPHEIDQAVRDGIMVTVSARAELEAFATVARRLNRMASVHLKVDTGMGRLGEQPARAVDLLRTALALPNLRVAGLYTHFSSAEDDRPFTALQRKRFAQVLAAVRAAGLELPPIHAANSAGLLHEPEATGDLVRPGLLVYGVVPAGRRKLTTPLKQALQPALTWKCRVGIVRRLPAGATISYGRTFTAPRALRVATITAGYGDGYSRAASGKAQVLINGRKCPVLGRITMDQMVVDVSRAGKISAGDEVVLIGRQGKREIDVHDVAAWQGTIPWEAFTSITYRVPRVYRGASAA
jgi:alanine racemase